MEIHLSGPLTGAIMASVIIGFFMVLSALCICGSYIDDRREMRELEEIAERAIRRREKRLKEEKQRQQQQNGSFQNGGGQIFSITNENRKNYCKSYSVGNIHTAASKKVKHFQSYRKNKMMQAKLKRKSLGQVKENGAANVT